MKKLQLLHDYLLKSGLVTSESLEMWVTEGGVFGEVDALDSSQSIENRYQINIAVDNYPFTTQDITKIFFALKWWLDVYEPDPTLGENRLAYEMDIKTSTTAYVWIGIQLTEGSWLQSGEIHTCLAALLEDDAISPNGFLTYLSNVRTSEKHRVNGSSDGSVSTN